MEDHPEIENFLFLCYQYLAENCYSENDYKMGLETYREVLFITKGRKKKIEISILNMLKTFHSSDSTHTEEDNLRLLLGEYLVANNLYASCLKLLINIHNKSSKQDDLEVESIRQIAKKPKHQGLEIEFYPRVSNFLLHQNRYSEAFDIMMSYKKLHKKKLTGNFETLYVNCHLCYGLEKLKEKDFSLAYSFLNIFAISYIEYKNQNKLKEEKLLFNFKTEISKFLKDYPDDMKLHIDLVKIKELSDNFHS